MATLKLGDCSIEFVILPLTGTLVEADRQFAWRLYLELVARPFLQEEEPDSRALSDLIAALRGMLADWPAARIEAASPGHLGCVTLAFLEFVLMPCLRYRPLPSPAWHAAREFCQALASDLARIYHFREPGAQLPPDLGAAWTGQS